MSSKLFAIALGLLAAALVVQDGALSTGLGACALVVGGVAWFESGTDSTRELAVIATLAAAAAAGRVLFAAVPGVQPVTVIVIVAGASLGALLSPVLRNRWALAAVAAVLGFAFSASMDVWLWYGFSPHTLPALVAVLGRGLWFDVSHAAGNVLIALAAGPELRRMLDRYGARLRTVVVWA